MTAIGPMVNHALGYADRGRPIFPVWWPNPDGSCGCGDRDCDRVAKHPCIAGGFKQATAAPNQIKAWWRRWPLANIAMPTGTASGVFVLDVDLYKPEASTTLAKMALDGINLDTFEVASGSGNGFHLYYTMPTDVDLRSTSKPIRDRYGEGIDVRSTDTYVVLAPSKHASGGRYDWGPRRELAPVPRQLVDLLCQPPPAPAPMVRILPPDAYSSFGRYWRRILHRRLEELDQVTANRNDALNDIAFRMGQVVALGAPEPEITEYLIRAGWALSAKGPHPFTEQSIRATVASGLKAGKQHPDRWYRGGAA